MKSTMKNICTPGFATVLLAAVPTITIAAIKPVKGHDQTSFTDYQPPSFHTNQGGRSHGGNTTLITPGMFIWKPAATPAPTGNHVLPHSLAMLVVELENDAVSAYTEHGPILDLQTITNEGFGNSGSPAIDNPTTRIPATVPAPGGLTLLLLAGIGVRGRRRRRAT